MIRVYSQDEELLAVFANDGSSKYPYFDDELYEELNGISELIFSVPMDHPDAQHVVEENLVVIEDPDEPGAYRLFSIKKLEEVRDEDGKLYKRAECEEQAIGELNDEIVTDRRPQNTTALEALKAALESEGGSRWQVGTVDATGNASTNFYYESRMSALQKILETWQMEVRFRVEITGTKITGRYVDLFKQRGEYNGIRVEIGRNLKSIKRTVETDHIKTALYGRGKGEQVEETGGYGRRLTFADVVWSTTAQEPPDPVDKPAGQEWVGDPEALERWGYPNPDGTKRHRFGVYVNEEQEDPEALLRETWEELQRMKDPRVTYETTMADLGRLAGYPHYRAKLGDVVRVIDKGFNPPLTVEARVIKRRRPISGDRETELTLGNFRPEITDLIREIRREVGKKVEVGAPISWLETKMQTKAREMDNLPGYMAYTPGQGFLVANAPDLKDATSAIEIRGGGFRISNKPIKKPDGTVDFEWRTFGDGDGFTADEITTGTLNANLVEILSVDLATGNTRKVEIYDGNLYTYYEGQLTAAVTGYSLDFFDHGKFSDGSNKGNITGKVELAWSSKTGDPSGEYNARGIAVVTLHDLLGLAKTTPDDEFSFHEFAFYWNKGQNRAYLSGPGSGGDYSKLWSLTLTPDHYMWNFHYRYGPSMFLGIGADVNGNHYSGVYFSIGDKEHGGDGRYFEVWEHRDTSGTRYPAFWLDANRLYLHRDYLHFRKPGTISTSRGWIYTTDDTISLTKETGFAIILDRSTKTMYFIIDGQTKFWIDTNGGHSI